MDINQITDKQKAFVFIAGGIFLVILLIINSGMTVVNTGHRGVKTTFGKVVSESLPEGLYFYNPLTSNIAEMDVRTQRLDGDTSVYTKDAQQAKFTYAVNFNLTSGTAHIIYQSVGQDWQEKLVPQIIEASVKNIIGKWNAMDLIANRDKVSTEIESAITTTLARTNVRVTKFELKNVDFSDEFEKSVEQKVVAQQEAERAQNQTIRIQEEAKQKVIAAEAEAKSMQIRTEALRQSQSLVEYEAVQKWDGKLPQYMMGNSVPFINLSK